MDSLNLPTSRAYWQKQTPYRSIERLLLCFMDHIKLRQIFFGHHDTINPLTPTFHPCAHWLWKRRLAPLPTHPAVFTQAIKRSRRNQQHDGLQGLLLRTRQRLWSHVDSPSWPLMYFSRQHEEQLPTLQRGSHRLSLQGRQHLQQQWWRKHEILWWQKQ